MRGCVNLVLFSSKQASKHAFLLILETTLVLALVDIKNKRSVTVQGGPSGQGQPFVDIEIRVVL